jgi:hypothetical protein
MSTSVFDRDKFGISQKHFAIGEKYFVRDLETNEDLLWVERDRLGRFTHMHVYSDKSKTHKVLHLEDKATWDFFGKWAIIDAGSKQPLLALKRRSWFSWLWRESWDLYGPEGYETGQPIGKIEARGNFFKTYLRKMSFLRGFMRLQFDVFLYKGAEKVKVMEYNRKLSLRDNYVIDCSFDTEGLLDRRIAVGLGLILDSSESR